MAATASSRKLLRSDSGRSTSQNRSEEHTSELQSQSNLVCRLLLEKKKKINSHSLITHPQLVCGLDNSAVLCDRSPPSPTSSIVTTTLYPVSHYADVLQATACCLL